MGSKTSGGSGEVGPDQLTGFPSIQAVLARVEASELTADFSLEEMLDSAWVTVYYPCERDLRPITYTEETAAELLKVEFESVRFLSLTEAMYISGGTTVEAVIRIRPPNALSRLPGVKSKSGSDTLTRYPPRPYSDYSLRVGNRKGYFLEMSAASPVFAAVTGQRVDRLGPTLKATFPRKAMPRPSSEIEEKFRQFAMTFFFELDAKYGIAVEFMPPSSRSRRRTALDPSTDKPRYPSLTYPHQALSLYQYARWASGLPLLAFLGYYQVLEFFFPIFSQRQAVERVRQAIRHPAFSAASDRSILDVVRSAQSSTSGYSTERQFLASTIEYCTTSGSIMDFVGSGEVRTYFTSKKQPLVGMPALRLDDPDGLLTQVAERVYDIRCRIVHTKADGGDGAVDLLLPNSAEVRQLGPDVELVRLLAQRALVAGAEPLDLN